MKKLLLSLAALSLTASMVYADQTIINFLGTEDCYGLPRQTTIKNGDVKFTKDVSFEQDGVNFSLAATPVNLGYFGTGEGVALVNAGQNKEGLLLDTATDIDIKMTVPNGTITKALVMINGYAVNNLNLNVNGKEIEGGEEFFPVVDYLWEDETGAETITITLKATYGQRYLRSIELTYQPDLGGKLPSDLSFGVMNADAIMGEDTDYPTLDNPHNLPIIWSSSDESVATIDPATGIITLIGGGKTVISATTEGNTEYGDGFARYTLTVIPVAYNIPDLSRLAPVFGDRVKVDFPLIVTFGNGNYAYVKDEENNVSMVYDARNEGSTSLGASETIYSKGDVIPAGWIARNNDEHQSPEWKGLPADATEVVDVVYPEVTSVTPADNNRVVILKSVTFKDRTPSGNERKIGTTPDGQSYRFEDTFDIGDKPSGCYNVTCVVKYAVLGTTEYFWLAPISYEIPSAVETIESEENVRYFNLQGMEVTDPVNGLFIKIVNGRTEKVLVK